MAASTLEAQRTGYVPMKEAVAAGDGRTFAQIYPPPQPESGIEGQIPGYLPTRQEQFALIIRPIVPEAVASTLKGEKLAEVLETMIDHTG